MSSKIVFALLSLFTYLGACVAYKYVVSINDDLGPCDNGSPYLDKYTDMSNVMLTKLDDDVLLVDGNMTTLVDFPPDKKFVVKASYYRKERGGWTLLPMKQVFPDFCAVLFSPAELWFPVADQLEGDARKCPPPKGTVYTVNKAKLVGRYEFAITADGEYRAQIDATYGDIEICAQITAEVREDV